MLKFKLFLLLGFLLSPQVIFALTANEFLQACGRVNNDSKTIQLESQCTGSPQMQIYLGGLLDAIGYDNGLRRQASQPLIYCLHENKLFDFNVIVDFVRREATELREQNMTASVIKYLNEKGGCHTID